VEEIKVILVTGDRNWSNVKRIRSILSLTDYTILVEGECRGADRLAAFIARSNGKEVIGKAADWKDGKKGGVMRNQAMLDEHPQIKLVLAFHNDIDSSRGTKDMINRAVKAGKKVILYTDTTEREITELI